MADETIVQLAMILATVVIVAMCIKHRVDVSASASWREGLKFLVSHFREGK